VCRTCDRNAPGGLGERSAGEELACRIRDTIDTGDERGWTVRAVACLNGCLNPCNVAFRGADRYTYRFSRLNEADVDDILAFGEHYWSVPEGAVEPNRIPGALHAKMTVCTPPRGRW
jgi:predicted metal-binding protein